jgi:FkbM family methyltransferase
MNFKYGIKGNYKDITNEVLTKCVYGNLIFIPDTDGERGKLFGDPIVGTLKHILVDKDGHGRIYSANQIVCLNYSREVADELTRFHQSLKFKHGRINDEYMEQIMVRMFLKSDAKVLEIGANIGRNSLNIASIVKNGFLVTLECGDIVELTENRDLNNMNFHIENCALSYRKLIQRGWDTFPSDELFPGFTEVKTKTFEELTEQYGLFDTLVCDCEGALYYILEDKPEMLENIRLIILENDFHDIDHKAAINKVFGRYGFYRVFACKGGWGPCEDFFYETWVKI